MFEQFRNGYYIICPEAVIIYYSLQINCPLFFSWEISLCVWEISHTQREISRKHISLEVT
jgi:hypothetical protein